MSRRRRSKLAKKYRKNPDFKGSAKKKARRRAAVVKLRGGGWGKVRKRASRDIRHDPREPGRAPAAHGAYRLRRNPSSIDWADLGMTVGYGFGGFALSRFATRVTSVQVAKRWPTYAKHAGVAAGLVTFLAAVFFAKRSRHTAHQAETLQIGTGLALAQTVIQTYFPTLGWVVADCTPEIAATAPAAQVTAPTSTGLLPDDEDDDSWGGYNDAYDHGRHAQAAQPRPNAQPRQQAAPAPQATRTATHATGPATDDDVDSILAELDDDNLGVFAN